MPIFEYKGINNQGGNTRGTVDADNLKAARAKLKKDGVYVVEIHDKQKIEKKGSKKKTSVGRSVGVEDLSMATRQLATLLKANVPLVESLGAISEQVENQTLKEAFSDIKNMVNEGSPLAKSLAKYPRIFKNIYVSMVEAGEMSGTLDIILIRLAEFTESQSQLQAKIRSALMYPIIMMVVTMGMLAFMFIFVVPKLIEVFEAAPELKLEWYTLLVINASGFMVNYWMWVLAAVFGAWVFFKSWTSTPSGAAQWDTIVLKIPVVGKVARQIAVSRFTRTLATLLTGGVPMLTAMDIVRNVVSNAVLARAIDQARDNISEGENIAGPLKKSGEFPPIVTNMINIGEKTGDLENMLLQVSEAYDFEVKTRVDGLTSILNPVLIVIMGSVIAMIVFAILIPMFEMASIS